MTVLLGIALVGVALIAVLSAAALVEVFRQLSDIRDALDLRDAPTPLGIRSGELQATDVGLPSKIAAEPRATVVMLSTTCSTCLTIAESFVEGSPTNVWFVISGAANEAGNFEHIVQCLAKSATRVVVDDDDAIFTETGLRVTPTVLTISYGEIERAHMVSTHRQVLKLLQPIMTRRPTVEAATFS